MHLILDNHNQLIHSIQYRTLFEGASWVPRTLKYVTYTVQIHGAILASGRSGRSGRRAERK
mgnify:CR=1 FL=1